MNVKITPLGIFYIIIMLLFGFAAINTANNLLYMITSFMMAFMIISGVISYYNIKFLEVTFVKAYDFFANEPGIAVLSIKNRKNWPSFLLNIFVAKDLHKDVKRFFKKYKTFEVLYEKSIFILKAKEEKQIEIILSFEKRGNYKELEIYLSSDFPFGFAYREMKYKIPADIYVYPNPKQCKTNAAQYKSEKGFTKTSEGQELYQIKEYQSEHPKYINWKASAKVQKLMVNDFSDFISKEIILRPEDFDMDLEQKLSCMSFIVLEASKQNAKIGLDWNGFVIPPSDSTFHYIKILRFLATA
ncbi:MAG: DUF58 domain-containing protein [Hydrogenobaculum sp.]